MASSHACFVYSRMKYKALCLLAPSFFSRLFAQQRQERKYRTTSEFPPKFSAHFAASSSPQFSPSVDRQRRAPEVDRSLKLGNVWVFVQLILIPRRTKHQLNKNPNIALLLPSASEKIALPETIDYLWEAHHSSQLPQVPYLIWSYPTEVLSDL